MAMHRLPAGTEGPRWRLLAVVWVASLALAAALAFALNALTGLRIAQITTPILWLAIQWAAWLYLRDRPAHPRPFDLETESDDSPTLRLETVEANPPAARRGPGDHSIGRDLDRPAARHALKEPEMPKQNPPTPYARVDDPTPAQVQLPDDRFAPLSLAQVEEAAFQIQWTRWNFSRTRAMSEPDARRGWKAQNRYLAEQVRAEAAAALRSSPPESGAGGLESDEYWSAQMERMIDWFNPPDEDSACEAICMDAVERAYRFAESQPCTCDPAAHPEEDPFVACPRCQVLGRVHNKAVQR